MALTRIQREIQIIQEQASQPFLIQIPNQQDLFHITAEINGPEATPYEGGKFLLNIEYPEDYPFSPPKINIQTPIFHPNITKDGKICMTNLEKANKIPGVTWTPALTLEKLLYMITSLISCPDFQNSCVPEIGLLCRENRILFEDIARQWTAKYSK
eukprot:TRINITY_DN12057_c0_g1_i1.p1 TRINITY_DN12057_c0_g1~~TRINITY_DN12057_c0_g1_i1.p1  ORF type:complete len:156 (+),score=20.06 TRINITY_DN12057_c0_g1_i1:122-589(+)